MRSFECASYDRDVWRVVECQNKASTLRVTDTLEDQAVLEELIEDVKPPIPASCRYLHFLLATPFRYAPYPHASRFRRADSYPGVFYAAENPMTAISEIAFYRLLFFNEAKGVRPPPRPVEHRAFSVHCLTEKAVDTTLMPLAGEGDWTNPTEYADCHVLADESRVAGVEVIRYQSVRDQEGRCVAVLDPVAFAETAPRGLETWKIFVRADRVQVWCEFPSQHREFTRADFANDPRIEPHNEA